MNEDSPPKRRMIKPPEGGSAHGRNKGHTAVKTAKRRTASSAKWLERQLNDPFVAQARAEGWRSRAAFKLLEIQEKYKIFRKCQKVVDLGCAPGGWLQVVANLGIGSVIGIDILPVDAMPGVEILQGDFTDPAILNHMQGLIDADGLDVVMSDLAHNTVGHKQTDHLKIIGLLELAYGFATDNLKPGGVFIAKAFQGGETAQLLAEMKLQFKDVRHFKPKSSRSDSSELYLVALGFKG